MSALFDLINTWQQWQIGKLPDNQLLWGTPIFWWGRIGKALQVTALAVVLVEILGVARLNRFGRRVDKWIPISVGLKSLVTTIDLQVNALRFNRHGLAAIAEIWSNHLDQLYLMSTLKWIIASTVALYYFQTENLFKAMILFPVAFLVGDLASMPLVSCVSLAAFAFRRAILTPIIVLASSPSLNTAMKLLTFPLIVAGLHFDFLAS